MELEQEVLGCGLDVMSLNGSLQAPDIVHDCAVRELRAQKGTLNKFLVDGRVCCSCWASGLHLWSVQMISRGRCSPAQNCFAVLQKTLFHVDGVPSLVQCTFISLKGLYEDGAHRVYVSLPFGA